MKFDVTITRTGSVSVEAKNVDEAFEIVNEMSVSDIERNAQLTGWEPSDVLPTNE